MCSLFEYLCALFERSSLAWWKDVTQIVFWLVAIFFGVPSAISAVVATVEMHRKIRHSKAEMGHQLIDKLQADKFAARAMVMLEPRGKCFLEDEDGNQFEITRDQIPVTLRKLEYGVEPDDREQLILECFDYYFFHLDRIRHAVENRLVRLSDISPLDYYISRMSYQKEPFRLRMNSSGFARLPSFLEKFPSWRDAQQITESKSEGKPGGDFSPPAPVPS